MKNDAIDDDGDDDFSGLVANMNELDLDDNGEEEERKKLLDPNNPVYDHKRSSSKVRNLFQ